MWILGGNENYFADDPSFYRNDVWSSADGVAWTRLPDAPWKPRLWHSAVVYRDRIWGLGGNQSRTADFNDAWYSKDGIAWKQLKSKIVWKKRHEHSTWVHQDRIWICGGTAEPGHLNNEVWSLFVPPDWFGE
ncbi:MAG: hypothetical protein H0W72_06500 [Planctomycetes bacterium]|nr:hypothetical protein [Planctomycetota bacterium]